MKNNFFLSSFNEISQKKIYNSITGRSIYYNKDTMQLIESALQQQLINIENDNALKILQIITSEFLYRGIIIPQQYRDFEEEYLQDIVLFVPAAVTFCSTKAIGESLLPELKNKVALFCGIPSDMGAKRPGSRFGPDLIRSRSTGISHRSDQFGFMDISSKQYYSGSNKVFDAGNISLGQNTIKHNLNKIRKAVASLSKTTIPFFLGGDHLISLALIESIYQKHDKKLAVIQLDHHLDVQLWGEFKGGKPTRLSEPSHSNFISWLKHNCPDIDLFQIGVNAAQNINYQYADDVLKYLNDLGSQITNLEILMSSMEIITQRLPKGKDIYLTIDVDIISSVYMEVTGYPSSLGITPAQLFSIIDYITKNNNIIAIDIMEFGSSDKFDVHLASSDIVCNIILLILKNLDILVKT